MKKEKLNEYFNKIEKLLNEAEADFPQIDYRAKWLMDRDFRTKMFEENPKCFLTIRKSNGNDLPLIPICNRSALDHPMAILMTLKIAKSFVGDEKVDQDHLDEVIRKLELMK
jgi:hypothetical protein